MRLRGSIAVSLLFLARSAHPASAQATSPRHQSAPQPAATHRLNTDGISRFELQRMLTEVDERRRRLRSMIEPADSVLRLFAADTSRLSAATRPPAIAQDSARVHRLFLQLRQDPASRVLRAQLLAAAEATADDFTSIEMGLVTRIAKPQIARDYLERTPFAAVVPVPQSRPLENSALLQTLREPVNPVLPTPRIPRIYLTDFEAALSDTAFASYKWELMDAFADRENDIRLLTKADREELVRSQDDAAELSRAIGQRQDDQSKLDARIVTIGIPVVGAALIILFLAPLFYRSEELRRSIITSGVLVELMTVFLLTAAVIILGVDGRIPAEVIGTLLGGVSGYVLGRAINPPARV
jgi:hypothetical protein